VGAHTDYALVRTTFGGSDLLVFYRDLIDKAAADLEDIGLAVLQNQSPRGRINVKAELRAIEYEIELMRENELPAKNPEAYAAVAATFRRIWSATRLIDRMRKSLTGETPTTQTELRIDEALSRFVSSRRVPFRQIFSNLTMASPSFRHALRVTIAVAVGFWLGRLLPLTNAYWIVMTTVIILKPGYSLTRQRNTQRIIGTLIGCAASIALILTVKEPHVLIVVMFASMVMSYSLLLFNYAASVVFTSSYVLLLFHLLAPGSMRIIGERAIDTMVGCAIAIAASHLFPYWEYRLMGKLVTDMIAAMRQYLDATWSWIARPAAAMATSAELATETAARVPAIAMATAAQPVASGVAAVGPGQPMVAAVGSRAAAASASATAGASAAASALDRDFRYRLARKNVHIAFANLGQAFQRMMLEPKTVQMFVAELNDLLIRSHALASQITAAAPLLKTTAPLQDHTSLQPLQRVLHTVRENLSAADEGVAPPADHTEITKRISRELDAMVVEAEKSPDCPADAVHELKLLAHQCKQMLAASWLIRKDASVIRLPEEG
jgi:uncharacterized membrane protein YccC